MGCSRSQSDLHDLGLLVTEFVNRLIQVGTALTVPD